MKRLNILHISDAHIQKKDATEIKELIEKLIKDVHKVENEQKQKIDLICFTGDMIQRGDKANADEEQWKLANDILIQPLIKALQLLPERFVFIPGNHEVDTSNILVALENGLQVCSLDKIDEILTNFDTCYFNRLKYFYDIVEKTYVDVKRGTLGYSFIREINGIVVGIACVDSAWRSSGKGISEKGKLYVGVRQIEELYTNVKSADIKICMMHHPIEWLEECEALEIEKKLAMFDIVLRGHVHTEDDKQIVRQSFKTVYSTAGKLYPLDYAEGKAVEGYNGYTILSLNLENNSCTLYLRTYYGRNRNEFDEAINICSKGIREYSMNMNNIEQTLEFNIIKGIEKFFRDMSEKYALIKNADAQVPSDIRQILIPPVLSVKSEYVKEDSIEEINLSDVIAQIDNILVIGKKESGKTTVLQQIALSYIEKYDDSAKVPIYLDMDTLPKGRERIFNAIVHFIAENILDNVSVSKEAIRDMIVGGKVVFLIDNVKINNANHTIWIKQFIESYGENRFILAVEEEFFQSLDLKALPSYGSRFKKIYIQYMGKAQIREMVTKWTAGKAAVTDVGEVVDKIDRYCNQINFAKTPFNIAVLMVLWDSDNNFIPVNEGIVMQNYLQIVLEKLAPRESLRTTYSFTIKQDFLSYLAHEMFLKQEYFFSYDEFVDKVSVYHRKKGYNLNESKFDKIFFEKNILSYSNDSIVFSHTSILEYLLAVYALNDKEFLNHITSKGIRINFRNEICFYSGMNQNCIELLDSLSDTILDTIMEHLDLVENLNEFEIVTEFKMSKEDLIYSIQKNRLSQEELDDISDMSNLYQEKKPMEMKKAEVAEGEAEDFFSVLQMYGSIIKNAELLDNSYKIQHLENYMYGMNMLYAILLKLSEYMRKEMKYENLSEYGMEQWEIENEEEFESIKREMVDITKLLFPIAIQNLILESVGTPKLEIAINTLMREKHDKPFEKFMLIFLKCDLKIANLRNDLYQYIKHEKSKGILKIIMIKLKFYYKVRFFGVNEQVDKILIDLITEISMKLNPPHGLHRSRKSGIAQNIRDNLDRV